MSQVLLKSEDQASIKQLVISALQAEENELKTGILKTREKLAAFERKYRLSTDEFLKTPPDRLPFDELESIEWAGEHETLLRLENELARLAKIAVC
jgi:hypothetical protein